MVVTDIPESPPSVSQPAPGLPSEVRWKRQRADKVDPFIFQVPPDQTGPGEWEVKQAPWWLSVQIVPGSVVLQVAHCGWFAGKLVLRHRSGTVHVIPVFSCVYPRVRHAIVRGVFGFAAGTFAAGWGVGVLFTSFGAVVNLLSPSPAAQLSGGFVLLTLAGALAGLVWAVALWPGPAARSALGGAAGTGTAYLLALLAWWSGVATRNEQTLILLAGPVVASIWGVVLGGWRVGSWALLSAVALVALAEALAFTSGIPVLDFPILPELVLPVASILSAATMIAARLAPRGLVSPEQALTDFQMREALRR